MAKKTDCEAEILELRKQIEELSAQQAAKQKNERVSDKKAKPDTAEHEKPSQLREKVEEFAELLEQDLKQIPAATAVAIFALGVLMGRFMSK